MLSKKPELNYNVFKLSRQNIYFRLLYRVKLHSYLLQTSAGLLHRSSTHQRSEEIQSIHFYNTYSCLKNYKLLIIRSKDGNCRCYSDAAEIPEDDSQIPSTVIWWTSTSAKKLFTNWGKVRKTWNAFLNFRIWSCFQTRQSQSGGVGYFSLLFGLFGFHTACN